MRIILKLFGYLLERFCYSFVALRCTAGSLANAISTIYGLVFLEG